MKIKGEYSIHIRIPTMFNEYTMEFKKHNLVTDKGVELIMNILAGISNDSFGDVHVGTGTTSPQLSDTINDFIDYKTLNDTLENTSVKKEVANNTLTYNITTDGSNLNETSEIGVWNSNIENPILISHDVHDTFSIPAGSLITLNYKFTMTNNYD